jgi:uncharacterized membrane protein
MRRTWILILAVANLAVLIAIFFPTLAPSIARWGTVGVVAANLLFFGWASRWV